MYNAELMSIYTMASLNIMVFITVGFGLIKVVLKKYNQCY